VDATHTTTGRIELRLNTTTVSTLSIRFFSCTNNLDHYAAPFPREWQLYDLENDLFQTRDLRGEHPDIMDAMSACYENWWREIRLPETLP
jgi:hypothetical protein